MHLNMNTSSQILILGYGEMGHAMEFLLRERHSLAIWERFPLSGFTSAKLEDSVPRAEIVLFCLPVNPHREVIRLIAPYLQKDSLCISIAKGLDEAGQTAAQIFSGNLPAGQPYALLYGPMIAEEIRAGRHAFGQLGCLDVEIYRRVHSCFGHTKLHITHTADITGINWSVILKNIYAMAFGMADELKLGDNVRGYLTATALDEMRRIVQSLGGDVDSVYWLAGLGDLITTATSESSHHHELGRKLAKTERRDIDITGEGPHTLQMIDRHQLINVQNYPLLRFIDKAARQPCDVPQAFADYLNCKNS